MKALLISLLLVMSAALAPGQKKGDGKFITGAASSYPSKQTNDSVTVAAVAYDADDLAHTAFGKLNPNQFGVLPVLVIIQNDTGDALRLDHVEVEYIGADGRHVDATPPSEIAYLNSPSRPKANAGGGSPIPPGWIKHKNPLAEWEIEGRAFAPHMLPPHEAAHGFFYFQARHLPGAKFYLTGIQEARTGKDVIYFEIPLDVHR